MALKFLQDKPVEMLIAQDYADAKVAAIWGTATFYINGKSLMALSPTALHAAVSSCVTNSACRC